MRQPMPQCKSPTHPGADRDTMLLVDEKRNSSGHITHYVFACLACRDINHVLSVQVRVAEPFRQAINQSPRMQQYKQARLVERDSTNGKIKYFR